MSDKIVNVNGDNCPVCKVLIRPNIDNRLKSDPDAAFEICYGCGVTIRIGFDEKVIVHPITGSRWTII